MLPTSIRVAVVSVVVVALLVACGSGADSTFETPAGEDAGGGGSSSGDFQNATPDGGGGPTDCKRLTCADQKIECGPAGDGCGGLIPDCGTCGAGLRCGGPSAPSKCVSPSIGTACVPKTCAEQGIQCGLAGDGCGGTLTCPSCQPGEQCGVTGKPSQCVVATAVSPDGGACVQKTCADYLLQNKNCGPQSDGCGGMVDCGKCVDPEFCGGGGPSKCAISGGGVCVPKTCTDFPGKCGVQSNGCGGVTPVCGTCTGLEICGGGGTPSVCGGGTLLADGGGACVPKAVAACGANECGQVADGCGGVVDCGTAKCASGTICGGAGVPNQCGAPTCVKTPTPCPVGSNCGSVADGCGGTVSCGGLCTGSAICGGGGIPNKCGGGTVVGCVPKTVADCAAKSCGPIADGCGGVVTCGNCISPELCGGGGTPSVCGGGNQCTPNLLSCGTMNCGFAADGCGGYNICGANAGACPTDQSCGLFAPNQCGSLKGPCIVTGAATTCTANSDCCSGSCGLLGKCLAGACKNLAVACATGNECCSGTCTGGVCATGNGGACKASGSTCAADSECCSKGCDTNTKTCTTATSYCKQTGDACTASTQCCGGLCSGATGTQAGHCVVLTSGSVNCTIAGTVVACNSTTTQVCNQACCSGSCGPNDSSGGLTICQRSSSCSVGGELCKADADCCGNPISGSLICAKPNGAGPTDFGRCSGENACNKPGQVCKTQLDACSFSNTCCPPAGENQSYCSNNPNNCCRHDKFGVPRCTGGACKAAGSSCESSAECCPIVSAGAVTCGANGLCPAGQECEFVSNKCGVVPPCTGPSGATVCAFTQCIADDGVCGVDGDCCNGNCFRANAGDLTGTCKIPKCTPLTCQSAVYSSAMPPKNCGQLSDTCGGLALNADPNSPLFGTTNCGDCIYPQKCGGSGTANVCGGTICTATTCAALLISAGIECGSVPDGCGGPNLTCGPCPSGTTCGGGGVAYKCGKPTCTALTCAGQGIECGQTGDGCGNILDCPLCPSGTTCGGGGVPNKCGAPVCTPITKCPAGKNCGDIPNGCGGSVHCGDCVVGETCGGGGSANVCGKATCVAKNCAEQGAQCGSISDQCSGIATCAMCGANEFCNGQNLCVALACTPKTCVQLNVQCGPTADGCGGLVDCLGCPVGSGCGAGGVPGKCGTLACAPRTCADLSAVCGQVADGCGGLTPSCGTCAGNLSCKNGACVQACTPITCASVGANCGPIADGCGGSIDCGTCTGTQVCGYNQANVCGQYQPK